MKITIIGWYGTETIGDRAILGGIITVFSHIFGVIEINLGSLFPFFSERTVKEDSVFFEKMTGKKIKIQIFDSKVPKELNRTIKNSDMIVMGGGPLMHISELHLVNYAFKQAKRHGKKTIVFGCGIGPISNKKYHKTLISILKNSDISYIRDHKSIETLKKIKGGSKLLKNKQIIVSHDPAVIPCLYYQQNNDRKQTDYTAVNLRKFPVSYSEKELNIDNMIIDFLNKLSKNKSQKIKLVPMHYFSAGNDDREYFYYLLNKIKDKSKFEVQNIPLNLEQTIQIFADAEINIGMRYHSVVFQTLANGNNYILDYTEPQKGKISGFIETIDKNSFYADRYINVQQAKKIDFKFSDKNFKTNLNYKDIIENSFPELTELLK